MRVNTSYAHGFKNDPDALYITCGSDFNLGGGGTVTPNREERAHLGFDQYGKIRWLDIKHIGYGGIWPIKYNGKLHFVYYQWAANALMDIYTPSGKIIHNYPNLGTEGIQRLYHDAIMINEHTMAIPETKGTQDESVIVEFDLLTGSVTRRIDLDDIIDPIRVNVVDAGSMDYKDDRVHINSLAYSASDDSYVISARHQGVIKIRRNATAKSGLVWWITPSYNVGADYQFSLLTPTNFDGTVNENWCLGQHSASILENGDIMIFDNHNQPILGNEPSKRISRILVYRVNEVDKTVEHIYEWQTPKKEFTFYQSNAIMLPNERILSGWSQQKRVYETSYPDGKILFQGEFNPPTTRGDIYRFYKINLYD